MILQVGGGFGSVFGALVLAATLTRAAKADDVPSDPGRGGDWLAFAWIDVRPVDDERGKAAIKALIGNALGAATNALLDEQLRDQAGTKIADAVSDSGSPLGYWLLADGDGGRVRLESRLLIGDNPSDRNPVGSPLGPVSLGEWPAHRAAIAAEANGTPCIFELAVNVNMLRRHLEEEYTTGRAGRVVKALGLSNARVVGLHAMWIAPESVQVRDPSLPKSTIPSGDPGRYGGPPLVCVRASWSARSDAPGTVRQRAVTAAHWPRMPMGEPPESGLPFVMAARVAWRPLLDRAIDVYEAGLPTEESAEFRAARLRWQHSKAPAAARLVSALEPWIVVAPGASGKEARSELGWSVRLRDDVDAKPLTGRLQEVIAPVGSWIAAETDRRCATISPERRWSALSLRWCVPDEVPGVAGERAVLSGDLKIWAEAPSK